MTGGCDGQPDQATPNNAGTWVSNGAPIAVSRPARPHSTQHRSPRFVSAEAVRCLSHLRCRGTNEVGRRRLVTVTEGESFFLDGVTVNSS